MLPLGAPHSTLQHPVQAPQDVSISAATPKKNEIFKVGSSATRCREVTNEHYLNIRPEATRIWTCFRMKMDISESACKTWASSTFLSSKCGASALERCVFRLVRDPDGSKPLESDVFKIEVPQEYFGTPSAYPLPLPSSVWRETMLSEGLRKRPKVRGSSSEFPRCRSIANEAITGPPSLIMLSWKARAGAEDSDDEGCVCRTPGAARVDIRENFQALAMVSSSGADSPPTLINDKCRSGRLKARGIEYTCAGLFRSVFLRLAGKSTLLIHNDIVQPPNLDCIRADNVNWKKGCCQSPIFSTHVLRIHVWYFGMWIQGRRGFPQPPKLNCSPVELDRIDIYDDCRSGGLR
ncbi:hypothetical protein B0H10DRAFT_1965500 [Mycena sp. CBHHK59/15]|nr:hypothetical protein B0H10DRAFT_1965500 [Mycena sp. CBHHK59/15]